MKKDTIKIYNSNMYLQLRKAFNILQKRIIHFVVKQLQDEMQNLNEQQHEGKPIERTLFGDCYFYIPAKAIDPTNQHVRIKNALKGLQIPIDDENFIGNFLYGAKRIDGNWRLLFPEKAVHFLTEVSKGVTPLGTLVYLSASSIYTVRMYELLMRFRDTGKWYTSPEDLAEYLATPNSYKKNFGLLRERAVIVAEKELKKLYDEKQSEIYFTFKDHRGGRGNKVLQLEFSIFWNEKSKKADAPKDAPDYEYVALNLSKFLVDNVEPKYRKANIEFMNKAMSNLREYGQISTFAKKIQKRVIDNPKIQYDNKGALLRFILEEDFGV